MATITTINAGDSITASRSVINDNFANLNADKLETDAVDTDTTLGANSDAKVPSQKAVKAFIESFFGQTFLVPTGAVLPYAGASAPANYLLCDGSAVSRVTYAALFAVIGTSYGAGDGSTTFNLPNNKGRVPVGRDSGQTEFDTLGETGGAKAHTLTTAEMPTHNYGLGGNVWADGGTNTFNGDTSNVQKITATQNEGGGGAHNNLQPYIVMNYIIKT